jgi:Flp pilus assembly protein TadD
VNQLNYNFIFLRNFKALVLLCTCGIVMFFATVHSPFLYDDFHAIEDNPYIKDLSNFQNLVGIQNIFNRSVLLLTFAINNAVGQVDTFGYHLVNITLHLCVGVVLYFLTSQILSLENLTIQPKLKNLPLVVSLIHLINPINVQAVTYISSRSSVLVTLFYLLSFYLLVRYRKINDRFINKWVFLFYPLTILVLFILGLGTKEIIVTLPIIVVLYLWIESPKKKFQKFLPELVVIFIPLIIYLLYRYIEYGNILIIRTDPYSHLIDRGLYFLTQIKVVVSYYLVKLFFPINLNFEPHITLVSGAHDWKWIFALMTGISLTSGIIFQKSVLLKGAFLWALVTIIPTSSIIPLKQFATEHRTYLPGIGISMGIGILFLRVSSYRLIQPILVIFLIIFGFLTINRSLDYRSEIKIWEDTAKKSPYKAMVHNNLGTAYLSKKRLKEAQKSFEVSSAIFPSSPEPYINMGHINARNKEWSKAKLKFDLALKLGSNRSQVFYHSGLMRLKLNKPEESIPFFLEAIKIKNHRPIYHHELGNAFRKLKKNDLALKAYKKVLELDRTHIEAQNNIGVVFWNLKLLNQAETAFKKALGMEGKVTIHNNLANLYIAQKRFSKAIPHLKTVIKKTPDNIRARNLLSIVEVIQTIPNK